MISLASFLLFANVATVYAISACNVTDTYTYANFSTKLINVESHNVEIPHAVGGSVRITNACTFVVRNITLIPTGNFGVLVGCAQKRSNREISACRCFCSRKLQRARNQFYSGSPVQIVRHVDSGNIFRGR